MWQRDVLIVNCCCEEELKIGESTLGYRDGSDGGGAKVGSGGNREIDTMAYASLLVDRRCLHMLGTDCWD